MPETIDSLTLDVGLTSEEFQAGVNQILGSMNRMQGVATETGESMAASFASVGTSIASLAWRFAGMFLAFKSIEGLVDYFKDLSVTLADLGFAQKYLGQSGAEMRRFGEVAELAGGKAQDAISAVQGLNAAIFGLEFQGQVSQSLIMLSRMRVAYMTPEGRPLPLKDVAFDLAKKLQAQYPGDANAWLRVQYAQQVYGQGGIANAVGGPLKDFEKFYAKASRDNKNITDKSVDAQMKLQQAITSLSYQFQDAAAGLLNSLTPAIMDLIGTIERDLIPTIDEVISDVEDLMHPGRMLDRAASGPTGWSPGLWINDLAHFGSFLGGGAASLMHLARESKLAQISVPPQVVSRLAPDVNLDALKFLHISTGGDKGDPTWSKAITLYPSLAGLPNGPAGYVAATLATGHTAVSAAREELTTNAAHSLAGSIAAGLLSTPSARRPFAAPGAPASPPTFTTLGPRIQIDSIGPIFTQATDAAGLMADLNRAVQRKLLVAQSDPGLA